MYYSLSSTSKKSLQKVAAPWSSLGKYLGPDFLNYGVPAIVGSGTAAYGYGQGQSPIMAGGEGLGAAMFVSPRGWRNVHREAQLANDPLTSYITGGFKTVGKKALPIGIAAAATAAPDIIKNINDTSQNLSDTTSNASKITDSLKGVAPNIAANLKSTTGNIAGATGDIAKAIPDMSKGVLANLSGMQSTMTDISDTSKNLSEGMKQLNGVGPALNRVADSASDTAKSVEHGVNYAETLPGKLKDSVAGGLHDMRWSNLSTPQKLLVGGLGAGAGGLLLHKLLAHKEKKPVIKYI